VWERLRSIIDEISSVSGADLEIKLDVGVHVGL